MVYAIQLQLAFRNAARRDAVAGNIQTRTQGLPQYGEIEILASELGEDPGLVVVSRFTDQADRDALWADLDAALGSGVNGPVTGSKAWTHDCQHDEDLGSCGIADERVW